MRFALFKEVAKRHKRKRRRLNNGAQARRGEDGAEDSEEEGSADETAAEDELPPSPPPARAASAAPAKTVDDPDTQDILMDDLTLDGPTGPDERRVTLFRSKVAGLFAGRLADEEAIPFDTLLNMVNEGLEPAHKFNATEATQVCEVMSQAEQILLSDGIVYKI